jgi:hypothetical protein
VKIGDVIESGIWLTGEENEELRKRYEADVSQAVDDLCREEGVIHGPISFLELKPGEERVPEVPNHISGQRVRLLIANSEVVDFIPMSSEGSFVANLELKDLIRLRTITRRAAKQNLTDQECDEIIEQYGPEAAIDTLQKNVGVSVH